MFDGLNNHLNIVQCCWPQRVGAAGVPPQQSFGLREEEMAVAVELVTHGMPSLRLFGNHKAADGSDVYEQFADIFTVLQVPAALCSTSDATHDAT